MKIRRKTWYWGNYCILTGATMPLGFEEYIEEKHGWHNSEEFIKHGTPFTPHGKEVNYRNIYDIPN